MDEDKPKEIEDLDPPQEIPEGTNLCAILGDFGQ